MLTLPTDRDIFTLNITVRPEHIDGLNHVNNVVYLQWVQDVAEAHWKSRADTALLKACMWVVMRHEIDYHAPALLGNDLVASTWIVEPVGPRQGRYVSIQRIDDGKVLCSAKTTWCLLDPDTTRPKRIPPEISAILGLKY